MSTPRERREEAERILCMPGAMLSADSRGRMVEEEPCEIRTCFQRDIDRIVHSKSFRRLKHKTQVFLQPEGDHYRTRMTHTIEVVRIARTISRALGLNEDLTEAVAWGTTSVTRRSATPGNVRWTAYVRSDSDTMSKVSASCPSSRRTERDSI